MVGASDSIGDPMTVMNTIAAEAFAVAADRMEKAEDAEAEALAIIKEYMTDHQRIVFNGNGYAPEWIEEAKRRGIEMPITEKVYAVLYEGEKPQDAIMELMARDLKSEVQ